MFNASYLAIAAFLIGFILTLTLAAWFTPSHWWRQLNARALAIVGFGTWGIGTLILWLAQSQAPAMAAAPAAMGIAPIAAGVSLQPVVARSYRVHEALNLRAAKGTASRRIAVVPAGTVVTTTGKRDGDWWQLSARVGGKDLQGWSSSLWLRRADEGAVR